ncbi:MAG: Glu/Leu/Phe/Val dehydrogenase dimerization domain-containing protein [Stappiaceae bacterium]
MNVQAKSFAVSGVFEHPEFDQHEQILFGHDAQSGLSSIIAIHNTRLGPALGGCRMWPYQSTNEALEDALRLSRGMTFKNALAGLELGGGKSVIIADPRREKTDALLAAFGKQVHSLGGRYLTAEDVGISSIDMEVISTATPFAKGTQSTGLGDPSPYTALGVFCGLKAAVSHINDSADLQGVRVCVQGLGHVGYRVAQYLHEAGADLTVADIHQPTLQRAIQTFGAKTIAPEEAHSADVDVFAPCALGAGLNRKTIPEIRASIVAGAANNQLADQQDGRRLKDRGILYAPDYAINAGGVISIAMARPDEGDHEVRRRTFAIADTLSMIFRRSDREGLPPSDIADRMAQERLDDRSKAA